MKKKTTISDVADLAGVSQATVSRVLAGKVHVNEDTREKVNMAINKLGYQPSYTARALATNSTNIIGVVVDRSPHQSLDNSFFVNMLEEIAASLTDHDKDILLIFSDSDKKKGEASQVKRVVNSKKVDGIIKLTVTDYDQTLEYLDGHFIPTVAIGHPGNVVYKNIVYVDNDNVKAMREVVQYLIDKGDKKIAFFGDSLSYISTRMRKVGYEKALLSNGLGYSHDDFYFTDYRGNIKEGLVEEIIEKDYDAIACSDDLLAYKMSEELIKKNIRKDITGFNNTYHARMADQPIPTVDINEDKLAEAAVDLLLKRIDEEDTEMFKLVDTKFIENQ